MENTSEDLNDSSQSGAQAPVSELDAVAKVQQEMLYLKADLENYKKRILREQDQAIRFANEKLIREVVGLLDLFDKAVSHGDSVVQKAPIDEVKRFVQGVQMTQQELVQLLRRFGVEFIGAKGEAFDPARHEAVSQVESDSPEPIVMDVLERGCVLQGRTVKPARVIVSRPKESGNG